MRQDERGVVIALVDDKIKNPHLASMKPGAICGNHKHDWDEVICILGGEQICQIITEDQTTGKQTQVVVDASVKTYRFKAGVTHTVKNIGQREFYLLAFGIK